MLRLKMNRNLYVYDIQGLLMAFYPGERILTEIEGVTKPNDEAASRCLDVSYEGEEPARVSFSLTDGGDASEGMDGKQEYQAAFELRDEGDISRKTLLKRKLYDLLRQATGKTLPWGTLTGIRPTKIAMGLLKEGRSDAEIRAHMEDHLLVSREKSALAVDIAKREAALLQQADSEEGYSLYIGIPFCPTICLYCSFSSYPLTRYEDRVGEYLKALYHEIDFAAEAFRGRKLNTVYFGGGTPTTLSASQLSGLLEKVCTSFDLKTLREWTVEAGRPDSVTREKLLAMKQYPVSRISINPQTMHQRTLDLIGRRHTVEEILSAYRLARECDYSNINMDLIVGLPGETDADVEETFIRIADLAPENVTIHSLALKRASRLNLMREDYSAYRMENSDAVMARGREIFGGIGLQPYYLYRQKNMAGNQENVGYALPGKEGLYNILIMEEIHSIVALGAGATTKRVNGSLITRAENVKDVDLYIRNIDEMIERKRKLFGI